MTMTDMDAAANDARDPAGDLGPGGLRVTKPGRTWLIKTVIMTIALIGFGCWALYDAVSLYPARGAKYAEFAEYQYLQLASQQNAMRSAAVREPTAAFETLNEERKLLGLEGLSDLERARYAWLDALRTIGRLNEDSVKSANDDPRARLAELATKWETANTPKPLAAYDIPSQWIILVVCWGLGFWLLSILLKVLTTKYRWDASELCLHLPGGATLTPDDLEEIDKRKWDKFLVFLKIKSEHSRLGGKELRLDLYRHDPLESWILEMERVAFPEEAAESAGQEADEESQETAEA